MIRLECRIIYYHNPLSVPYGPKICQILPLHLSEITREVEEPVFHVYEFLRCLQDVHHLDEQPYNAYAFPRLNCYSYIRKLSTGKDSQDGGETDKRDVDELLCKRPRGIS